MKKIYIRADANANIGIGHIMRCIPIAKQLQHLNYEVTFVTADDNATSILDANQFHHINLHSNWQNLEEELEVLIQLLQQNHIDFLLIDSYFISEHYFTQLKYIVKTIYLDDMDAFAYPVDMLINYSVWVNEGKYENLYKDCTSKPVMLLGKDYIPLREEFQTQTNIRHTSANIQNVLITTGGADLFDMSLDLTKALLKHPTLNQLNYHIVVGKFNPNKDNLAMLSNEHQNIILHENVTYMSGLMKLCDAAISASGSTLYELCSMGLPTICFEVAANQNGSINWELKGLMKYGGNAELDKEFCIQTVLKQLLTYTLLDNKKRTDLSNQLREFIDGNGVWRIARAIKKIEKNCM